MPSFFTGGGDEGSTGLLGKERVPKYHPRIEALGALDEANAFLGLARAFSGWPEIVAILKSAQRDLYALMAEVAATPENAEQFQKIKPERVLWLEGTINRVGAGANMPSDFILPGDSKGAAFLDAARVVIRRAERRVAELLGRGELQNRVLLQYLNRLSSLCFVLELLEIQSAGLNSATIAKEAQE